MYEKGALLWFYFGNVQSSRKHFVMGQFKWLFGPKKSNVGENPTIISYS
jgi:hypothetical protein